MTIHLRSGNMAETCHVDEKVDYHVSAKRKRNGYKKIHVSVGFTKYGNMQFRPVLLHGLGTKRLQLNVWTQSFQSLLARPGSPLLKKLCTGVDGNFLLVEALGRIPRAV